MGSWLVLDGGVLGNVPPSPWLTAPKAQPRLIREGALHGGAAAGGSEEPRHESSPARLYRETSAGVRSPRHCFCASSRPGGLKSVEAVSGNRSRGMEHQLRKAPTSLGSSMVGSFGTSGTAVTRDMFSRRRSS